MFEFVDVVQPQLIIWQLDDVPCVVVEQIEVGAVWWPQVWSNERGVACSRSCTVSHAHVDKMQACWHKTVCYFKEYLIDTKI